MQVLYKGLISLLLFFCVSILCASAQNTDTQKINSAIQRRDSIRRVDSILDTRDSIKVYRDIEKFSTKRKFTDAIYKLIFRQRRTHAGNADTSEIILSATYREAQGKPIRRIIITTYDPIGNNIENDSSYHNSLEKTANAIHIKTLPLTIQNLILIKKNQPFDSLLVIESERLIKLQIYTHDAIILPVLVKGTDSVDIIIKELDNWTLIPVIGGANPGVRIGLNENDFLGLGHRFYNTYANTLSGGNRYYNSTYYVPNFRNTYISGLIEYGINQQNKYLEHIDFERPFYSSYAKWAGGIYLSRLNQRDSSIMNDTGTVGEYRHFVQDYWAGRAWKLRSDSSVDSRTTNFVLAARFYDETYYNKPLNLVDSLHQFENELYYLASVGISSRKYKQERYVYKYGITEFVPVGRIYQLTTGYDMRDGIGRWYTGGKVSWGQFYKFGYMSPDLEYGTFIGDQKLSQQTISLGLNYFTSLISAGDWKFRQFIKANSTLGIDRLAYETVSINNALGIEGFNSPTLTGNNKIVLTVQSQSYAPWSFLGFNFGPYALFSIAMVGQNRFGLSNSKLYTLLGIGVLIDNEYLVINTFQISLGFYPYIPGIGNNILKIDPYKTTDLGFTDFQTVKPYIVPYQ